MQETPGCSLWCFPCLSALASRPLVCVRLDLDIDPIMNPIKAILSLIRFAFQLPRLVYDTGAFAPFGGPWC